MKQEYFRYFTDVGIKNDKGNVGSCTMFQSFETDLEFMRIKILTKFHKLLIKTVPSRVYTRFFFF